MVTEKDRENLRSLIDSVGFSQVVRLIADCLDGNISDPELLDGYKAFLRSLAMRIEKDDGIPKPRKTRQEIINILFGGE